MKVLAALFGWFEALMGMDSPSHIDHQNDERCVKCGGRLVFDQELTTRRGSTEWAAYVCSCCGEEHHKLTVLD